MAPREKKAKVMLGTWLTSDWRTMLTSSCTSAPVNRTRVSISDVVTMGVDEPPSEEVPLLVAPGNWNAY